MGLIRRRVNLLGLVLEGVGVVQDLLHHLILGHELKHGNLGGIQAQDSPLRQVRDGVGVLAQDRSHRHRHRHQAADGEEVAGAAAITHQVHHLQRHQYQAADGEVEVAGAAPICHQWHHLLPHQYQTDGEVAGVAPIPHQWHHLHQHQYHHHQ
ncbi:MAG: hypothetical protein Harvfovirus59_11 [Harvfovirus sp.]|uniref:Uncharacterized protein n=1 Tax=Harvfovirus sp. TaxID=2487768 RepID=A0A3G5A3G5_9VIRU|nr:MAG: hypothetical protein Harvfovirus59_11 [Harvfovirus sp.]